MENSIISGYYEIIFGIIKADGLCGENGKPLFRTESDFCRYCEQIIRDHELQTLRTEVMVLEKTVDRYQKRFNIAGSVHKVFFEETPHGKAYKYLYVEQLLLAFHRTPYGLWTGFWSDIAICNFQRLSRSI